MQSTAAPLPAHRLLVAAWLVFSATACGSGEERADEAGAADAASTAANAGTPAPVGEAAIMGDAEVAAILAVSDTAEIQPSRLALERGQSPEVKQYAQRMVTEHSALSDSLRVLTQQMGITPAPTALSQQLQSQTQTALQSLQGLTGAAFDSAYVQLMAQSHQATLATIDSRLLPATRNAQLRTALEQKVRPAVAMHLEQARQMQGSLRPR